jgi:streptogramin lyase
VRRSRSWPAPRTRSSWPASAWTCGPSGRSVTQANNVLSFTTSSGSNPTTYTGGGLSTPVALAVDGAGYIWVANQGNNSISAFSNAGTALTPTTGYTGLTTPSDFATPTSLVLDTTGGIWVTNKSTNSITHVFGAATPVTTPLSQAVTSSTLGTKP